MFVYLRHFEYSLLGTMTVFKYRVLKAMFCFRPDLVGSISINYAIKRPTYSVTQIKVESLHVLKLK